MHDVNLHLREVKEMIASETLNSFLKPLVLIRPVGEKQLPANLSRQLGSIVHHFKNKRGNTVLFTGTSNSESNSAASLLGKQIGRDVYRIDLSAVASEHLGETEKNLLQIFEDAEKHLFILLFDEVQCLFGKRAGIRSCDDIYANLDMNYLLKRIEAYSGLVIFTTSSRDDLDEALLRAVPWRIDLSRSVVRKDIPWWRRILRCLCIVK